MLHKFVFVLHLKTFKASRIINDEYRKDFGVRKEAASE
jgi:hypothetical protein